MLHLTHFLSVLANNKTYATIEHDMHAHTLRYSRRSERSSEHIAYWSQINNTQISTAARSSSFAANRLFRNSKLWIWRTWTNKTRHNAVQIKQMWEMWPGLEPDLWRCADALTIRAPPPSKARRLTWDLSHRFGVILDTLLFGDCHRWPPTGRI